MSTPKIQPFDDLILVRPYEVGGDNTRLVLSSKTKAELLPYVLAEVLAVGAGRQLDNGQRREMNVKVGDKVMFAITAPIFPLEKSPIARLNGQKLPAQALINIGHLLGVVETDAVLKYAEESPFSED